MIKKIMSLLLSVAALFSGFAVKQEDGIIKYRNMPYGIRCKRQILDLDIPESVTGDANMILYIHGGGWNSGSKDESENSLDAHAGSGIISAALNYRYCGKPNYATMDQVLDDISHALAKIKETAAQRGINIKGVVLTGGSAGAHLSLLYAYKMAESAPIRPIAVYAQCPAVDFTDSALVDGSVRNVNPEMWTITPDEWLSLFSCMTGKRITQKNIGKYEEALYDCSPIKYVNENTVPTIIAHGTKDSVLPYEKSKALADKLEEYGVPHEFITFEGAWHDLQGCPEGTAAFQEAVARYNAAYLMNVGE